jgi:hypothetical protein
LRTYYELLGVAPAAAADEIKRAFRREIARYHPDKVQHLGTEFQEIAAVRAAELTEAYRILMDEAGREQYDHSLKEPSSPAEPASFTPAPPAAGLDRPGPFVPESAPRDPRFREERATITDFVRKAGASRLQGAVRAVAGSVTALRVDGLDLAYDIKGKTGLFRKSEPDVRLLIRFLPQVDSDAIASSWPLAVRGGMGRDAVCLLLFGAEGVAPTRELAAAVAEQRRKTRNIPPIVIPVDMRDWEALFPPETPGACRAIVQWLRDGK